MAPSLNSKRLTITQFYYHNIANLCLSALSTLPEDGTLVSKCVGVWYLSRIVFLIFYRVLLLGDIVKLRNYCIV